MQENYDSHLFSKGGRKPSKTNKGYRVTKHINRKVTQSVFRAFDYAKDTGTPLNLYVVINLHENSKASVVTIFSHIRHKYRDWLYYKNKTRDRRLVPTYIYTIENPNDAHPHANWVVHIPEDLVLEFNQKVEKWVAKAQGECGQFDCNVQEVNQGTAKTLAKYVVKATDPVYIDHFFLQNCAKDQGLVFGKRAGVSPSLGHAVRKKAEYKPRRQRYWQTAA